MRNRLFFSGLGLMAVLSTDSLLAQDAPAGGGAGGGGGLIGIVLMFAVFFLLIIWPQSRKAKKHAQFLSSLEKGDEIVTQSGIHGKIHGLTDRVITLEIAPNVRIRMERQSVAGKAGSAEQTKAA